LIKTVSKGIYDLLLIKQYRNMYCFPQKY